MEAPFFGAWSPEALNRAKTNNKGIYRTLGFYLVAYPTARKWVITPIISGLTLLIPFITGVIIHLLSGMSHQVGIFWNPITRSFFWHPPQTSTNHALKVGDLHIIGTNSDVGRFNMFSYLKGWDCSRGVGKLPSGHVKIAIENGHL